MPDLHPIYAQVFAREPGESFSAVYAPMGLIAMASVFPNGKRRRHYLVTPEDVVMTCAPELYLDMQRRVAALWPDTNTPQEVAR